VLTLGREAMWLMLKRSLVTIYKDVYDEHLFVFAVGRTPSEKFTHLGSGARGRRVT